MRVYMDTERFEITHGHKPRGYRHWTLLVTIEGRPGEFTFTRYEIEGTLSECRRQIKLDVADTIGRASEIQIEVLP